MRLGLTSEQFWALTPRQFSALIGQWDEEQMEWDGRFGRLVALVHNIVAKRPKGPADFFPRLKRLTRRKKTPQEELLESRILQANLRRFSGGG